MTNQEFVKEWKNCFDTLAHEPKEEHLKQIFVDMIKAREAKDYRAFVSKIILLKLLLENCKAASSRYFHQWTKTVLNTILSCSSMTLEELEKVFEQTKSPKKPSSAPKRKTKLDHLLPKDFEEVSVTYNSLKDHDYKYETLDFPEKREVETSKGPLEIFGVTAARKEDVYVLVYFAARRKVGDKLQKLNVRWQVLSEPDLKELFEITKEVLPKNSKVKVKG